MKVTPYKDVNEILHRLSQGLVKIFGKKLIGFYFTGSLSYGNFRMESSDIDLVAVLETLPSGKKLESVKKLHLQIEEKYKKWAKRIECSYISSDMLKNILPPSVPRPYIGEGVFYPKAPYGNEWLINYYLLYTHGVALIGPDFRELVQPIDIVDVQKACIRDLFKEWKPKITDPTYLQNSHYQSYVVLNLCRILNTVMCAKLASKKNSASWIKSEYPPWRNLIEKAEEWKYGKEMNLKHETVQFIQFVVDTVQKKQP